MNRLDWTHLGGMPLTQNRLKWMQDANLGAFSAIAKLCGDKTILCGIEVSGGNVSSGWFSYNGELIEFIGGSVAAKVNITDETTAFTYSNAAINIVQYKRTATCGIIGDFNFSELVPLSFLSNVWLPGDVKEKYCDDTYLTENFDSNGFGLNREKGWRILSKAVPSSAGKVFINHDPSDLMFNTIGETGGAKTHTLTPAQQGKLKWAGMADDGDDRSTFDYRSLTKIKIGTQTVEGTGLPPNTWSEDKLSSLEAGAEAHPIMNPFFVILKLIKL